MFLRKEIPNQMLHNSQLVLVHFSLCWGQTILFHYICQTLNQNMFSIYVASKNPMAIWVGYLSTSKKIMTKINISWDPFDIHKSKLTIVDLHFAKVGIID